MTREIGIVPPDRTMVAIWPDVGEIFRQYGSEWLEENELSEAGVLTQLLAEQWELWLATDGPVLDGIMLTQLLWSEFWVLWACGQHIDKYLFDGLSMLERFALHNGAREVVLGGRPGWDRVLERLGYVRKDEWLRKDLVKAYAH